MTDPALPLPPLSAPARRALADAGVDDLRALAGRPEREVLALHGLGPAQLGVLRGALADHGLAFTGPVTTPAARPGGRNDNAVFRPSGGDPRAWIETLPTERRRAEGLRLLELFGQVTGENAAMWGPSIVGYGHHHYVYDTGREGDTCRVGFSPRSSALSLYGLLGLPGGAAVLDRLGPHKAGKGCLYVTSLARVDETALRDLVDLAWHIPADPARGC